MNTSRTIAPGRFQASEDSRTRTRRHGQAINGQLTAFLQVGLTRLPLLEQRSDFFRGGIRRISAGFRHFTSPNGV